MNKNRFKWLGLVLLSLATLLVMGGCGGGGSSTQTPVVAKVTGTVSFPTTASVSLANATNKTVLKSVALIAMPTVELRDLAGTVVKTAVVTATDTGYSYTFDGVTMGADYVVKAYIPGTNQVIKALIDKNSLLASTTKNVDTISTTAVILTEEKLGAAAGSMGDAPDANITTSGIATNNPLALEVEIKAAISAVLGSSSATSATQAYVDLINLVNTLTATVFNNINTVSFIAGIVPTAEVSTTQYVYTANVAPVATTTSVVSSTITTNLATVAEATVVAPVVPVVVTPPVTATTALKASLTSGWYELRSENVYNSATNTDTAYYYIERMGLLADGVTLASSKTSYYDRGTKTWTSTAPAGFPINSSLDYTLSTTGTWVHDDGPNGYTAVFNADGTALVTAPNTGEKITFAYTADSLAGLAISSSNTDGAPLLATATAYPAGSIKNNIAITSLADGYQLWSSYSQLTSLSAIPAAFDDSVAYSNTMNIENPDRTVYFYGKFVSGSTTNVKIYRNTYNSQTSPTYIGDATASTITVLGNAMLEINIPAALKTTYNLSNTIFAVVNGIVMEGSHYTPGLDLNRGGTMLNDIAVNHIKANIDTALAKPVVAKSISKAILGM